MMEEKELNLLDAEGFADLIVGSRSTTTRNGYYGLGTVRDIIGNKVSVALDSSPNSKSRSRRYLSSYSPSKGDRVLILHDIVIGKIK